MADPVFQAKQPLTLDQRVIKDKEQEEREQEVLGLARRLRLSPR
jgi:hypothetical protein